MRSIRTRLIWSYLAVIFITAAFIIISIIFTLRQYYITNIEDVLLQQAETAKRFYWLYMSSQDIDVRSSELINSLSALTDAEIQILDKKGIVLQATQSPETHDFSKYEDVETALYGNNGIWMGTRLYTGESVLAVSVPLSSRSGIEGIIRFVTSLEEVNKVIRGFAFSMTLFGFAIMIIVALLGAVLANGIVRPLEQLTRTAEEMAGGVFAKHTVKKYNDEIGKLADTLNFMADEINKQEKVKQDFIASISHEIRTPLTSIKGWAITLKQYFVTEEALEIAEGLAIIEKESDRLTLLVDDLLDFSKLAANNMTLNIGQFDVVEMLRTVVVQMNSKAKQAGMNINMQSEQSGTLLHGDKNRLRQVFINILDNALKFSPEGSEIKVALSVKSPEVEICVIDHGKGIAEDELPSITKKFYKSDNKAPGSGLGLAICNEIIKLHGGSLIIESEQGAGTVVIITLPM